MLVIPASVNPSAAGKWLALAISCIHEAAWLVIVAADQSSHSKVSMEHASGADVPLQSSLSAQSLPCGPASRAQYRKLQGKHSQWHMQVLWHCLLSLRRQKAGTPKAGTVPAAAGAASTGEQQPTSAAVAAEQPASLAPASSSTAAETARGLLASQGVVLPSLAWLPDGSAVAAVDMWGNVAVVDLQCRQLPLQYGAVEALRAAETLQVQMPVACCLMSAAMQEPTPSLAWLVCIDQDAQLQRHRQNGCDWSAGCCKP